MQDYLNRKFSTSNIKQGKKKTLVYLFDRLISASTEQLGRQIMVDVIFQARMWNFHSFQLLKFDSIVLYFVLQPTN